MTQSDLGKLIASYLGAVTSPHDIVDIRLRIGTAHGMYAAVIPNDSCVIMIANSLDEVKRYIKQNMDITSFKRFDANVREIPIQYRSVDAYVAEVFGGNAMPVLIYNIGSHNWPTMQNGMKVKDYIKTLM